MKILELSWEFPPKIVGGIARVVEGLSRGLGDQDCNVHVVTSIDSGSTNCELTGNVCIHRVRTYDVKTCGFIEWVLQMNLSILEYCCALINKFGPFDIVHAHDWMMAYAGKAIKNAYSMPLVSTMHALESGRNWGIHNDMQRYIDSVEWWLCYESRKVFVNSLYMLNEVVRQFQLPSDKIIVIPNGIVAIPYNDDFDRVFRRNYADDSEKIVFFIGRLVHEKGAHILVEAIPKIISYYNNVKFVIAGKGPQLDYLRSRASALGCSGRIYFTGFVTDDIRRKLFKCADIAVFPSLYEPFGIVALEAMVSCVPLVVSDTGGLGEIIQHGYDGMKSYVSNPMSLADSILELLYDPLLASRMVKNAYRKVITDYNWDTISIQVKEVFQGIIASF